MGYLEDLQAQINYRDFNKFWQLWEEYCTSDEVDLEEFASILKAVKGSDFAKQFGQVIETALPLWQTIKDPSGRYEILRLLMDLQTTNSSALADLALDALKNKYGQQPQFAERLRLVGLRTRENFQGALSYYDLLSHMDKGKYVFHIGGWGTGEIVDISPLREQASVEFENISGRKHFTFIHAFKNLVPLADDNFLARRFSDADALEKEAKEDPVGVIKLLLRDLGPKSAAEIKDELCELVIPENDWTKWWQGVRAKLKKDPMVESPESLKEPFRLRKSAVTHEERLHKAIGKNAGIDQLIQTSYSFVRDNPTIMKKEDVKNPILEKLKAALNDPDISEAQKIQIHIFLESLFGMQEEKKIIKEQIKKTQDFFELLDGIDVIAFKKRFLTSIRETREDWTSIFLDLLFTPQQNTVREYIVKELNQGEAKKLLEVKLHELAQHPLKAPEFLVWYFQKLIGKDKEEYLYSDKEGQCLFFEAFLILFSILDSRPEYKDLYKKMYVLLSGKRYAVVRDIIQGTSLSFIQEFLLLAAKCHGFSDHDQKVLRSLAEVVQPSLNTQKPRKGGPLFDSHVLWTTEEGYNRIKERMQEISTTEMVSVAREIEAARALGDLRENAEYKSALERRSRIQSELRHLSEQMNRARIIRDSDISEEEVSIGSVVNIVDSQGNAVSYTLLGPWDADADKGILSAQSKLAQAMAGLKQGDTFKFKDEEYRIVSLKSFKQTE